MSDINLLSSNLPSTFKVKPFQLRTVEEICEVLFNRDDSGALLVSATGSGKTLMSGLVVKRFLNLPYVKSDNRPFKVMIITPKNVKIQFAREYKSKLNLDVDGSDGILLTTYSEIRSGRGELFIIEKKNVKGGDLIYSYEWYEPLSPLLVILDEVHNCMSEVSSQSIMVQAYLDLNFDPLNKKKRLFKTLSMSATPFARPCEAKVISVSTGIPYQYGMFKTPLNNKHWPSFIAEIANPAHPREHCKAATKRLIDVLKPYTVKVKGFRLPIKVHNSIQCVNFSCQEDLNEYQSAYEEMLAKLAELGQDPPGGMAQVFAIIRAFWMKAEFIKSKYLGKAADRTVKEDKKQVYIGLNFKKSILRVLDTLVRECGYNEKNISTIWGGIPSKEAESIFDDEGDESDIALTKLCKPQNAKARQEEIDKFQRGESKIIIGTFKAGKEGLDLPHCDLTNSEQWPRVGIFSPTFNDKEFAQMLGRLPRLSSVSDVTQIILLFAGTIEQTKVMAKLVKKLECQNVVTSQASEPIVTSIIPSQSNIEEFVNRKLLENHVESKLDENNEVIASEEAKEIWNAELAEQANETDKVNAIDIDIESTPVEEPTINGTELVDNQELHNFDIKYWEIDINEPWRLYNFNDWLIESSNSNRQQPMESINEQLALNL